MVRRAAARQRIPVSLCGDGVDPALLTPLVGLGSLNLHDARRHRGRETGPRRSEDDDMRALAR